MPPYIKLEPDLVDDGGWTFVAGLGKVRSGPRGNQHRGSQAGGSISDSNRTFRPAPTLDIRSQLSEDHALEDSSMSFSTIASDIERRKIAEKPEVSDTNSQTDADGTADLNEHWTVTFSRRLGEVQRELALKNEKGVRQTPQHGTYTRDDYLPEERDQSSSRPIWHVEKKVKKEPEGHSSMFFQDGRAVSSSPSLASSSTRSFSSDLRDDNERSRQGIPDTPPPPDLEVRSSNYVSPYCVCPIRLDCPRRTNDKIDCRRLVFVWEDWVARQPDDSNIILPPPKIEEFATLAHITAIVRICNEVDALPAFSRLIRRSFEQMRTWIRRFELQSVTLDVLNQSGAVARLRSFLSDDNRANRTANQMPIALEEDLTVIFRKWDYAPPDLSALPLRGLIRPRGIWKVEPSWPSLRPNDKCFGHGHLVNGQKWPLRAAMCRDRAHGPLIAGISGSKHKGARSVVMGYHDEHRHKYYADVDQGDTIYYIGTALPEIKDDGNEATSNIKDTVHDRINADLDREPTDATQALMKSIETRKAVRVIRSFRLANIVPGRPEKGYRYDGLYQVVSSECLKIKLQIYRFKMVRLGRHIQGPLRGHSVEAQKKRKNRDEGGGLNVKYRRLCEG